MESLLKVHLKAFFLHVTYNDECLINGSEMHEEPRTSFYTSANNNSWSLSTGRPLSVSPSVNTILCNAMSL